MVTVCCWVAGLSETLRMNTTPWSTSLRASAAEMSGRDWSSSIRSSTLRPRMPPRRLISCAPKMTPSVAGSEYGFETPTRSVMTPSLIVSCAYAPAQHSAAARPMYHFFMGSLLLIQQFLLPHPSYTKFDRLLQQLGLPLVVVRGALDDMKALVLARRRVVNDARVRLRHRVIGRVLDREQRHRYLSGARRSIRI